VVDPQRQLLAKSLTLLRVGQRGLKRCLRAGNLVEGPASELPQDLPERVLQESCLKLVHGERGKGALGASKGRRRAELAELVDGHSEKRGSEAELT
jgi:hypothetical protein